MIMYIQPAMSAIGYLPRRWSQNLCEFVHSNTILQRELNICARSEARVCALLMCSRTNLLTERASSHLLVSKYLNWQSLHEFSLNTEISTCTVQVSHVSARYHHG